MVSRPAAHPQFSHFCLAVALIRSAISAVCSGWSMCVMPGACERCQKKRKRNGPAEARGVKTVTTAASSTPPRHFDIRMLPLYCAAGEESSGVTQFGKGLLADRGQHVTKENVERPRAIAAPSFAQCPLDRGALISQ